jgi:hypothetical protein
MLGKIEVDRWKSFSRDSTTGKRLVEKTGYNEWHRFRFLLQEHIHLHVHNLAVTVLEASLA